jgi:transposase
MARRRMKMRQVREILRYHYEKELSRDRIAGALGLSKGAVHNTLNRFMASGLTWPLAETVSDSDLEGRLFPKKEPLPGTASPPVPDMGYIEAELRRKHVTLELLYREYRDQHAAGMSRSAFYRYVRAHLPEPVDMKMIHKGGDLLFVDFSGDGIECVDRATGEIKEAPFFVCSWGASSYTYAEATETEETKDFVMAHERSFRYFGCVPNGVVPDNTKSAVEKPDRYEPMANPLYQKFTEHYNVAVLPARIRKPKDKAVVESNVGFCQRYILGRLRNRRFFSITEINAAIRELLVELNNEPMQGYGGQSRKERFEKLDQPYAQPLPADPFCIRAVKFDVPVAPNYHINFDSHFYSVPHHLARQKVDVYQDGNIVEIYHKGQSVARHKKQPPNFGYTTVDEHMPPNHRFVKGWSKEWFIQKAQGIGTRTTEAVTIILERRRHAQQGFNSALGVLNLARKYSPERLEAAAARAIHYRGVTYRGLRIILERNLDMLPLQDHPAEALPNPVGHENVRGPEYYAQTSIFAEVAEHDPA